MEILDSTDGAVGFENCAAEPVSIPMVRVSAEKSPYAIALPSTGRRKPSSPGTNSCAERKAGSRTARSAGPAGALQLRELAFPRNSLVFFVCALDEIFELAPIVRELLGHLISAARRELARALISMMARSMTLQSKVGYIDARSTVSMGAAPCNVSPCGADARLELAL
jgi:hypothetical protein